MNRPNEPRAFVALNKNELKHYDRVDADEHGVFRNVVFLSDGDEYEIGLDNPTSDTYLAKIKIDGSYISDKGIVLRPGEHMFLERYLDKKRRFRFETYEVPKRNSDAVKDNGLVEVEFYKEKEYKKKYNDFIDIDTPNPSPWRRSDKPWWDQEPVIYGGSGKGTSNTIRSFSSGESHGATLDASMDAAQTSDLSVNDGDGSMETGRTEEGSRSEQDFRRVNKSFQTFTSYTTTVKILPKSVKPYARQDIATYCTNCGTKLKDNWNNCPQCGEERP